jgi:hypothetical protein
MDRTHRPPRTALIRVRSRSSDSIGSRAGNRTRTGDPHLGKVVLYQLSYSRGFVDGEARSDPMECQGDLNAVSCYLCGPNRPRKPLAETRVTPLRARTPETLERRPFALLRGALATVLAASLCAPLDAQEMEDPLSPAGRVRLEIAPLFHSWDRHFSPVGEQSLERVFTDASGALLFPGIATLQTTLQQWLGDADYRALLGTTNGQVSASQVRVPLRVDVGMLDWLAVGVTVPLVKSRTEIDFHFRADSARANLGVNPAITRELEVVAFTDELRARVQAATSRAAQLCAELLASAECEAANGVVRGGQGLLSNFLASYSASPFFPLASSGAGVLLAERLSGFNQGLTALGVPSVGRPPLFATAPLSASDLELLLSDGAVGINTVPLTDRIGIWELGDVEVHAAVRLLDGATRDSATALPSFTYEVGAGALVRLGTGKPDDPDVFLDLPSGDGQTDIEGRAFTNVRSGRFGVWGDVRYGVQRPHTLERRVGPPDLLLVPAVNLSTVEWSPGDYLQLEVSPRYHLTGELAFTTGYRLYRKGADTFARVSPEPEASNRAPLPSPPVFTDVSLLARGTEERVHEVGAGLVFSSLEAWEVGRARRPFEARFNVRWTVAGSGRDVPKGVRALVGLRLYLRLWGEGS